MNPWNTTLEVAFDETHKEQLLNYYTTITRVNKSKRKAMIQCTTKPLAARKYLKSRYDDGYGLKVLARSLGLTYSRTRKLFEYLGIEMRTGKNVVTDTLKAFRSDRVIGDKNPFYDWCNKKPTMHRGGSRGIQGYYCKPDGALVWLRSTWEFIYASWLDKNAIKWAYEGTQYNLPNGEGYRPDFTILNDKDEIIGIVEVKGYFKNRVYKTELFREAYPTIPLIVVYDIAAYCSSYEVEKRKWKKLTLASSKSVSSQ